MTTNNDENDPIDNKKTKKKGPKSLLDPSEYDGVIQEERGINGLVTGKFIKDAEKAKRLETTTDILSDHRSGTTKELLEGMGGGAAKPNLHANDVVGWEDYINGDGPMPMPKEPMKQVRTDAKEVIDVTDDGAKPKRKSYRFPRRPFLQSRNQSTHFDVYFYLHQRNAPVVVPFTFTFWQLFWKL